MISNSSSSSSSSSGGGGGGYGQYSCYLSVHLQSILWC